MGDEDTKPTRLFNRTTQPRVLNWGEGVVMPGESFETDNPESFAPDREGSPWATDPEATAALLRGPDVGAGVASDSTPAAGTGPQDVPQTPSKSNPPKPDGDVVTETVSDRGGNT